MKEKFSKISHFALAGFLLGFVFVTIFGMGLAMNMDANGMMKNCPLMDNSSVMCGMSGAEHASIWQAMFSALPAEIFLAALAALTAALAFALLYRMEFRYGFLAAFSRFYPARNPESKFHNFLVAAFSSGILQPKIYA